MRSAPGSKTDATMVALRNLRDELIAEENSARPAPKRGTSKSARKRAAKRAGQVVVEIGTTSPGSRPKLNTGSLQVVPPSGKVSKPKGVSLKVMRDYIPGRPSDWTDPRTKKGAPAGPAVTGPKRDRMPSDHAKVGMRPTHEARAMSADRPSGGMSVFRDGEIFRDEAGRVVRTLDMPEDITPAQYAMKRGLPPVLTPSQVISRDKQAKADEHAKGVASRKATRAANRAQRETVAKADASGVDTQARDRKLEEVRAERALARTILAGQGITEPTSKQIKGMLDWFATNKQRATYMRANMTKAA